MGDVEELRRCEQLGRLGLVAAQLRDPALDGAIIVNGARFFPARRYRNAQRLREELEPYGFEVLHQTGEYGENRVTVHRGSGIRL